MLIYHGLLSTILKSSYSVNADLEGRTDGGIPRTKGHGKVVGYLEFCYIVDLCTLAPIEALNSSL